MNTNIRTEGTLFKAKGNPLPEVRKITTNKATTVFSRTKQTTIALTSPTITSQLRLKVNRCSSRGHCIAEINPKGGSPQVEKIDNSILQVMVEEVIGIDGWVTSCGRGKLKKNLSPAPGASREHLIR